MPDSLDAFRYISYMRLRWRVVAGSCLAALALAGGVSLMLPREYTATARIVIEPPAGADPRSAMAVSPIYLESLKTYEEFAASDSLFQKAIERFHLRALVGARPFESLKKSVLEVGLVRNTRILEISVTMPDPAKAQALAQFLAEETVSLNRSLTVQGGHDLVAGVEQQERDARAVVERTDAEWSRLLATEPVDNLQAEIEQGAVLRSTLEQQLASANLEIADAASREKQAGATEAAQLRKEQSDARARLDELRAQLERLDRQVAEKEKLLGERLAHRERLDPERKAGQAALTAIETRLRDTRNDVSYRGERLTIIDPGVVPERPSFPNIPLNLAAALLVGVLLPVVYLAFELMFQQQRAESRRGVFQALAKVRDE